MGTVQSSNEENINVKSPKDHCPNKPFPIEIQNIERKIIVPKQITIPIKQNLKEIQKKPISCSF